MATQLARLSECLGRPVTHLVPELVRLHLEIASIKLVTYRPAPALGDRLSKNADPAPSLRERADALHREFGIPFWDAVLAIAMKLGDIPDRYVDLAVLHDAAPDEREFVLRRGEVSEPRLEALTESLDPGYGLAISSRVALSTGGVAHVPMMDFRCRHSDRNAAIIKRALSAMGQWEGVLAQSPRSYHFYGVRLLSETEWTRFLALAILFSPVVDVRYIAHRLADGACRLRLCASASKGAAPVVVDVFP